MTRECRPPKLRANGQSDKVITAGEQSYFGRELVGRCSMQPAADNPTSRRPRSSPCLGIALCLSAQSRRLSSDR
jgi:hypothetical protein